MTNDANDWFDIGREFLIALPGILAAVFTWRIKVQANEIRDQVTNDHNTNLRDDIDRLAARVEVAVAEVEGLARQRDQDALAIVDLDRRTNRIGEEVRTDRAQLLKVEADLYQLEAGARRVVTRYHPEEGETL